MKQFKNIETEIVKEITPDNVVIKMGYADIALVGLNASPKEGWTTDEMRKRIKIIDKLEKISFGDTVDLEDAEFKVLVESSKINWAMIHRDIIKFDDYLIELSK